MSVVATNRCQVKGGLFGCKSQAQAVCQYCGRPFCKDHGVVLPDGQEICSRKFCVAKKEDLERHLAYRTEAQERNRSRLCGIVSCKNDLLGQCARCKAFFCRQHVEPRRETILENQVRVPQIASLCHHCWARRGIWLRV